MKKFICIVSSVLLLSNGFASAKLKDSSPPELISVVLPASINTLNDNSSLKLAIKASDKDTGLKRVELILTHQNFKKIKKKKSVRLIKKVRKKASSRIDDIETYDFDFKIPKKAEKGIWDLKLKLVNRAGTKKVLDKEALKTLNINSKIEIISNKDTLAPEIQELSFDNSISLSEGSAELALSIKAADFTDVQSVSARFLHKNKKLRKKSSGKTQSQQTNVTLNRENNVSEFLIKIPFDISKKLGDWLLSLKLIDSKGNKTTLSPKQLAKLELSNSLNVNNDPIIQEPPSTPPIEEPEEEEEENPGNNTGGNTGGGGTSGGGGAPAGGGGNTGGGSSGGGNTSPPLDPRDLSMPDSAITAPVISPGNSSPLDDLDFITGGANPIQTGITPGTIDETRATIVRGKIFDTSNNPVSNAVVKVHKHNEFGQTLTMANGEYNFVVNGGGGITVNVSAAGFLPIQRTVQVPVRDFLVMDTIVLTPLDNQMTAVNLNATGPKVVESSMSNDADGERQVKMLFTPGTQAEMVMPDGTKQPLTNLSVRATEFTVGADGPMAMPGTLPATSAYTYAVELSVDEAMAAGATTVNFNKAVPFYVDNYLNFPVGEAVPTGYYDREKAAWVASDNGRIIQILNIVNGKAEIDIDGSGTAASDADLLALGVDAMEQTKLADLYTVGKSIWRVPVTHFTPYDCNWPYTPPPDSAPPPPNPPDIDDENNPPNPCIQSGSIIECQTQTLGESLEIAGTPFTLEYRSNRVKGRKTGRRVRIPLSEATIPASLQRIDLEIIVAGRKIVKEFAPAPDLEFIYEWDGMDAFGREVIGSMPATITISYLYNPFYVGAANFQRAFAEFGEIIANNVRVIGNRVTNQIRLEKIYKKALTNNALEKKLGLGGWSLSEHHTYDRTSKTLFLGTGEIRSGQTSGNFINTVPGGSLRNSNFPFDNIDDVEVDNKGNIYFTSTAGKIFKLGTDGVVTRIAGDRNGSNLDGIPAIDARLALPSGLAIDNEGNIYFTTILGHKVHKIDTSGIITTIAGTGTNGFSGDGGPATQAQLSQPEDIAFGPDGSLYIADRLNRRIRKIDSQGIITTFAGNGNIFYNGEGRNALDTAFYYAEALAVGDDGSVYIYSGLNFRIQRITPNGTVFTIAGNGVNQGSLNEGGLATDANVVGVFDLEVDSNNNVYFATARDDLIRVVTNDGFIHTIGGTGDTSNTSAGGDGGPALRADINAPYGIALSQDGGIIVGQFVGGYIRKIDSSLGGFTGSESIIPSDSGELYYKFDKNGKHLSTHHALTNAIVYEFEYGTDGYLTKVKDGDGNETLIERNGQNITAIISPDSLRTEVTLDANGYIASLSNPAGEAHNISYTNDGLMTSFADPKGNLSTLNYDDKGRLTKDENAAGGSWTLARTKKDKGYDVTMTSAEGREIKHKVKRKSNGDLEQINIGKDGRTNNSNDGENGIDTTTKADGTTITREITGDPRFFMLAPITKNLEIELPSGLKNQSSVSRSVNLNDPIDPLSLTRFTETTTTNTRTFTKAFNANSKTFTNTSALGRTITEVINDQGRIVSRSTPGLADTAFSYDARGRLETITRGNGANERVSTLSYGPNGFLNQIIDPEGNTTNFTRDPVGRVTREEQSATNIVDFVFDANDNLTSITPPGKTDHNFSFTPVDQVSVYGPPTASGLSNANTNFSYNLDKDLTQVSRPDGKNIDLSYNNKGQLTTLTIPRGSYTYEYKDISQQLKSITAPNSEVVKFKYDGFLQTQEDWDGSIDADVDVIYDNNFFVSSRDVNDANQINFTYDADGFITSAGDLNINISNQNSLIQGTSLDNISTAISYNEFAEPTSYIAKNSGADIYNVSYSRDKLGRVTQKVETISGTTTTYDYSYDADRRLSEVKVNGLVARTYTYDTNGNRLSLNSTAASYDAQDRLLNYGANNYSYNDAGDLTNKFDGNLNTQYNYDALGNLVNVTLPDGRQLDYVIDGKNRRIGKKIDGVLTQGFVYKDQLNPIAELDTAGNLVSRFIYGVKPHVPDYMIKAGTKYRIISDNVGSVRLVLNSSTGSIAQRIDYDEFGNITQDTNPGFQPFGFAGGLYDNDTKLVRFGARDYDAEIGRWTAKDPILFKGGQSNLYEYLNNDPLNAVDITGLARFGKGPLINLPGNFDIFNTNPLDNILNTEIAHEQLFYDDDTNVGFFPENRGSFIGPGDVSSLEERNIDPAPYNRYGPHYDDEIIKQAVKNVGEGRYCLIGSNCQNWADKVRHEYNRIKNGNVDNSNNGNNGGGTCP